MIFLQNKTFSMRKNLQIMTFYLRMSFIFSNFAAENVSYTTDSNKQSP